MQQIYKVFIFGLLVVTILSTFFHGPAAYANRSIVVATDVLNVREKPDSYSTIIAKVQRGETYPVLESDGEWLKIQVSSSKSGWVASFLVTDNQHPSSPERQEGAANVEVLTDGLRVRSGPGTNFSVIAFIHISDSVAYIDQNENWVKVKANGAEGWVSKEFVSISTRVQQQEAPPASPAQEKQAAAATITTNNLNVRSSSSTDSTVLDSLSKGKQVMVIGRSGQWLQISYDQKTGWIHQDYAEVHAGSNDNEGASDNYANISAVITVSGLNVRSEPSLSGEIIGQVIKGTTVTILNERNNWAEIQYDGAIKGWVAGWFIEKKASTIEQSSLRSEGDIVIIDNGTNIRNSPSTNAKVVYRANEGETFPISGVENNWYKIKLEDGTEAYVAGWIVAASGNTPSITRAGAEQYLKNKIIVIDPGHGGRDVGAIGVQGSYEKDLTLRTSKLLQDKLKAAGATVYLTRQNDTFVSLQARANAANYHRADAFISLHYDSIDDTSVTGVTTYYHQPGNKLLADSVHQSLIQLTNFRDRQVRQENYLVLRENRQPSILLELGYVSNRGEELTILSSDYQERASTAIYQGLAHYFRNHYE